MSLRSMNGALDPVAVALGFLLLPGSLPLSLAQDNCNR